MNSAEVLNSIPLGILQLDNENRVTDCNEAATQIIQRPLSKIQGKKIDDLLLLNVDFSSYCNQCRSNKQSVKIFSQELITENLKSISIDLQLVPLYLDKETVAVVATIWENEKSKQDEEEERNENLKLESLSTMVSSMAHEIQNPLAGLKGATQLLERQLIKEGIGNNHCLEIITREISRIDRMVKRLLLHSREIPLDLVEFNIHEVLEEIIFFQKQNRLPVNYIDEFDPSLPNVYSDRDKIHQVLLNLIKNAMEASPENGKIRIITRFGMSWNLPKQIYESKRNYIYVDIVDEAESISDKVKEKIFTPFFTTKKSGKGLGLSISRSLMKELGGLLQLITKGNKGNCFRVWIPIK